ncbi:hypothetical protein [Pseudoflavonifractor capillosus]|uniref:Uncharacterized protein n=1 Tax=Pseudoflavonifractor capillosus TaxID=106588 RepID=A0A921MLA8_9FIRM|nr:hypothetical protein [Pseudoflavonifractor capillosus]HJG86703.1 hypothetical protein [Pseudoflavonifractor capillosus]
MKHFSPCLHRKKFLKYVNIEIISQNHRKFNDFLTFEGGYRENALRNAAYDIAKLKLCSGKRTTADADAGQEMMENKCSFPEKA